MATDSKNNSQSQGEIDLLYLFVRFGEFLKNSTIKLIEFIGSVFVFLLQKWFYFAIAVILTIGTALVLDKVSDPFYHSHMILRSNATQNQPIMSNLTRLGEYADTKNFSTLSEELNLSMEEASAIKQIESFLFYDLDDDGIFDGLDMDRKYLSDTSVVKIDSVFSVRVEVYNSDILKKLEEGLVYYIDNNPFLETLNKQRLSNLEAQLKQIDYEIEKLDSLQKREYYTNPDELRQKEGQIVFTAERDVKMYHYQMFELLRLKQDCERDLNIYSNVVTVIEDFAVPIEADNGTMLYLKKLIWYYLGLALLLAVILTFRKEIWVSKNNSV